MDKVSPVTFAKALADDTRQQIMKACCCEWVSVGDLAERIGVSQPTISHHLAILREAALVEARTEGNRTFYTLNQKHMVVCCGQLLTLFAPEEKATTAVNKTLP